MLSKPQRYSIYNNINWEEVVNSHTLRSRKHPVNIISSFFWELFWVITNTCVCVLFNGPLYATFYWLWQGQWFLSNMQIWCTQKKWCVLNVTFEREDYLIAFSFLKHKLLLKYILYKIPRRLPFNWSGQTS